jgi:hypothetical protein
MSKGDRLDKVKPTLDEFIVQEKKKKKLLNIPPPDKIKPSIAPINRKPRGPKKIKPIQHIENQPNIDVYVNTINITIPLDIIPDVPSV